MHVFDNKDNNWETTMTNEFDNNDIWRGGGVGSWRASTEFGDKDIN